MLTANRFDVVMMSGLAQLRFILTKIKFLLRIHRKSQNFEIRRKFRLQINEQSCQK